MSNSDQSIEELRAQTEKNERADEEYTPADERLKASIADAFARIERGETSKTLTFRDEPIAALLHGLEENTEEMDAVGRALQADLGRDADAVDRSEILRLAVRVGLHHAAPDVLEAGRDAHAERVKDQF